MNGDEQQPSVPSVAQAAVHTAQLEHSDSALTLTQEGDPQAEPALLSTMPCESSNQAGLHLTAPDCCLLGADTRSRLGALPLLPLRSLKMVENAADATWAVQRIKHVCDHVGVLAVEDRVRIVAKGIILFASVE